MPHWVQLANTHAYKSQTRFAGLSSRYETTSLHSSAHYMLDIGCPKLGKHRQCVFQLYQTAAAATCKPKARKVIAFCRIKMLYHCPFRGVNVPQFSTVVSWSRVLHQADARMHACRKTLSEGRNGDKCWTPPLQCFNSSWHCTLRQASLQTSLSTANLKSATSLQKVSCVLFNRWWTVLFTQGIASVICSDCMVLWLKARSWRRTMMASMVGTLAGECQSPNITCGTALCLFNRIHISCLMQKGQGLLQLHNSHL